MKFDPNTRRSESIRLKGYDYSQPGAYFVTICSNNKKLIFGNIVDGNMKLNTYGKIVSDFWNNIPIHFSNVEIDCFVVMPNHVYVVVMIKRKDDETNSSKKQLLDILLLITNMKLQS